MGIYAQYIKTLMEKNQGQVGNRAFDEKEMRLVAAANPDLAQLIKKKFDDAQKEMRKLIDSMKFPINFGDNSQGTSLNESINKFNLGLEIERDLQDAHDKGELPAFPGVTVQGDPISAIARSHVYHLYTDILEERAKASGEASPSDQTIKFFLTDISRSYDQPDQLAAYNAMFRERLLGHMGTPNSLDVYWQIAGSDKFEREMRDVLAQGGSALISKTINGVLYSRAANKPGEGKICDELEKIFLQLLSNPEQRLMLLLATVQASSEALTEKQKQELINFSNRITQSLLYNSSEVDQFYYKKNRIDQSTQAVIKETTDTLAKYMVHNVSTPGITAELHKMPYHSIEDDNERQQFVIGLLSASEKNRNETLNRQTPMDINHLINSLEREAPQRKGLYDKFQNYNQVLEQAKQIQAKMDENVSKLETFKIKCKEASRKERTSFIGMPFSISKNVEAKAAELFIDSYKRGATGEFFASLNNNDGETKKLRKAISAGDLKKLIENTTGKPLQKSLEENKPQKPGLRSSG